MKIESLKNTKTREILFIEVSPKNTLPDGKNSILTPNKGILNLVINAYTPFIPIDGGIGDIGFIIITPNKEYFYAFDYSKDLEGWKYQIINGAKILGIRIGQIDGLQFQILQGETYLLSNCEFEEYNFQVEDTNGHWIINGERRNLDKNEVLSESILKKEIYKTHNGRSFTKERTKLEPSLKKAYE